MDTFRGPDRSGRHQESPARNIKILFLASNPTRTPNQRLEVEARSILEKIQSAKLSPLFEVEQAHAVHITDLQAHLLRHEPHILHFSGYGNEGGEILLKDSGDRPKAVSAEALGRLFQILPGNVRCVVLNSGFSRIQASGIAESIDCVIGMSAEIGDPAALAFAASFYQGLGFGRSLKEAFDLGCHEILLEGHCGEEAIPTLICRPGVNPATIWLTKGASGHADDSGTTIVEPIQSPDRRTAAVTDHGSEVKDERDFEESKSGSAFRSRVLRSITTIATLLLLGVAAYTTLRLRGDRTLAGSYPTPPETVSLSTLTSPIPGSSPSPLGYVGGGHNTQLTAQTFVIKPRNYRELAFVVQPSWKNAHFKGEFQCSGGRGNDVEVFVTDREGFDNLIHGRPSRNFYASGRVSAAKDIDVPLKGGTYYLVFNNTFSPVSNKAVTANIFLDH